MPAEGRSVVRKTASGEVNRLLQTLFESGSGCGLSDGALVRRVAAGGAGAELAFAALLERHGPMVLRVCRGVLRDPHEAQDAFQATFLVLAQRAGGIRDPEAVACWLHGVALRAARALRSAAARRRRHERSAAALRTMEAQADEIDDPALRLIVHEEIGRLPARERAVLMLCDLEGQSQREAAGRLACPVGTIKSRLSGARRRLRARLARRGLAPGVCGVLLSAEARGVVLPWALREITCRAASLIAAKSSSAASGVVSASASALASKVMMTMTLRNSMKGLALAAGALLVSGSMMVSHGFQQGPQGGAPAQDRLQVLESKLDRLINVLERQAGQPADGVPRFRTHGGIDTSAPASPTAKTAELPPADPVMRGYGYVAGTRWRGERDDRLELIERQLLSLSERVARLERLVFPSGETPVGPEVRTYEIAPGVVEKPVSNDVPGVEEKPVAK
jgi:RNA polymerase sigma-70 factor (ECF subfamily)